jgi:replication fork protection complex subunit Tof1/Swi1
MLERYSKTKSFMFVRKRKAARKKRKEQAENPESETVGSVPDEENEEDIQAERDMPSYAEHAFTFTAFERVSRVLTGV